MWGTIETYKPVVFPLQFELMVLISTNQWVSHSGFYLNSVPVSDT